MISTSDNSSSEDEDSLELQRLRDAAVTMEPDGDLHARQTTSAKSNARNEVADRTKGGSQIRRSLRPSLRPKQTYCEEPSALKVTPGFRTHVARKLSDILDKELEFSESAEKGAEKKKSSKSGIRLLSSSKKFLKVDPNAVKTESGKWSPVWKPKSQSKSANSSGDKSASSTSRKRANQKGNKQIDSSSDSSEDEKLAEAAVSFQEIKQKDELLSSFAISRAPILIIQAGKKDQTRAKVELKPDIEAEVKTNESPERKKKKRKKKKNKEKNENSLGEENEDREKELTRKNKKKELCSRKNSLENNEEE